MIKWAIMKDNMQLAQHNIRKFQEKEKFSFIKEDVQPKTFSVGSTQLPKVNKQNLYKAFTKILWELSDLLMKFYGIK